MLTGSQHSEWGRRKRDRSTGCDACLEDAALKDEAIHRAIRILLLRSRNTQMRQKEGRAALLQEKVWGRWKSDPDIAETREFSSPTQKKRIQSSVFRESAKKLSDQITGMSRSSIRSVVVLTSWWFILSFDRVTCTFDPVEYVQNRTAAHSTETSRYCLKLIKVQDLLPLQPYIDTCKDKLHSMWRTETVIPAWFESHERWSCRQGQDPDHYLVHMSPKCLSRTHSDASLNDLFIATVRMIKSRFTTDTRKLVFIFPSGRGATIFPSWRLEIAQSIFLSPEPHFSDAHRDEAPYFDIKKDIIIPGYVDSRSARTLLMKRTYWSRRRYLFTFVGGIHGKTRIKFFNYFGQQGRPDILVDLKHDDYQWLMSNSKFCPILRGWSSWTLRFFEALWSECIPVLLSNHYTPPFQSVVSYKEFLIVHDQNNLTTLVDRLLQVTPQEAQERIVRMRHYRCHLAYFNTLRRNCNAFENIGRMLIIQKNKNMTN